MATDAYLPVDVRVAAITEVSPSVRRVTLFGPGLRSVAPTCLDRRIKLLLPHRPGESVVSLPLIGAWYSAWLALPEEQRPPMRTYTARAVRPERGEMDVDVIRHGSTGPAGRWIESVRIGDPLVAVVPQAGAPGIDDIGIAWRPGAARHALVVADETAAPAATNIAESLPADAQGTVLIEVPTAADVWHIDAPEGVMVRFLPREGGAHGSRLSTALAGIVWPPGSDVGTPRPAPAPPVAGTSADPSTDSADSTGATSTTAGLDGAAQAHEPHHDPDEPPVWQEAVEGRAPSDHYAWIAGESSVVTGLRRHLVRERGCAKERIAFMGYWKRGRSEN